MDPLYTISILCAVIGGLLGWLITKILLDKKLRASEQEMMVYKVASETQTAVSEKLLAQKEQDLQALRDENQHIRTELSSSQQSLAIERANNHALQEKLAVQQGEIEVLGKKFNTEFENIANKILETKTATFTEVNKANLSAILEPFGKNIAEFKSKVEEVYIKEAQARFSLGEKVKELQELNQRISEEANNLTKALKGDSKIQGDWGEVILENILENSGLTKDREYFLQQELTDDEGKAILSSSEDKKMRPDAIVHYPGGRRVIIDSKVSLRAYARMIAATDEATRQAELQAHIASIKNHIAQLSAKGYDDYNKSLDFVLMFVPNEAAYNTAMQGDPNLWNFAYDKRILLHSPTNLITSLKLIVDLWSREYQNRNAQEIAAQGAKLYDKLYGFVNNLEAVGSLLGKAQDKYQEAHKQLVSGRGNLISQAEKFKKLGLNTKHQIATQETSMELPPQDDEMGDEAEDQPSDSPA